MRKREIDKSITGGSTDNRCLPWPSLPDMKAFKLFQLEPVVLFEHLNFNGLQLLNCLSVQNDPTPATCDNDGDIVG